jgi:dUTP pyrophosphatase
MEIKIKLKKLDKTALLPVKQSKGAAGFDLYANEATVLEPGENKLVKTGFSLELPSGFEAQIRSRSGLALKNKVFVLNSPGTIDEDYRGEVGIILMNLGKEAFPVKKGDRIAQMIISEIPSVLLEEVSELTSTPRGKGGFGSTDKK